MENLAQKGLSIEEDDIYRIFKHLNEIKCYKKTL